MNAHLDLERTTYLVYGLLEEDEKVQVDAHVSDCSACADAVRRLEEERGVIVEATGTTPPREELVRAIAARVYDRVVTIRRGKIRRLWILGCAASLFLAAGIAFLSRTKEIAESRAALALGRVAVQRGEFWVDLGDGYQPTPGDRIRTDDPAGATIRLEEGSRFKITRGSMVEFRGARGPTAVLRLLEGEVRCNVVADPRPFTVEAAGATVTVVGTEFALHVLEDQPFFKVEKRILQPPKVAMLVTSGAVLMKTEEGEPLRVPAGWIGLAGTKGSPWIWGEIKELEADKTLDKLIRRTMDVKPAAPAAPIDPAWKERTDKAVQDCVDAVPWARFAHSLVRYHKGIDDAVREQRSVEGLSSDDPIYLALGWGKIRNLANELHLNPNDFMQACRNRLASKPFVEALVEALSGAELTDEQRTRLLVPETVENLLPVLDSAAPRLARWKMRAEKTLAFLRQLKDALPEEPYHRVTLNVGPGFLLEVYRVWLVEASSAEEAADRIATIWTDQFKFPSFAKDKVSALAAQHVRSHHEAQEKSRREVGENPTGVEELELAARLFDLQLRAEKALSEIPSLNSETRNRTAAGTDSLIRIRIAK